MRNTRFSHSVVVPMIDDDIWWWYTCQTICFCISLNWVVKSPKNAAAIVPSHGVLYKITPTCACASIRMPIASPLVTSMQYHVAITVVSVVIDGIIPSTVTNKHIHTLTASTLQWIKSVGYIVAVILGCVSVRTALERGCVGCHNMKRVLCTHRWFWYRKEQFPEGEFLTFHSTHWLTGLCGGRGALEPLEEGVQACRQTVSRGSFSEWGTIFVSLSGN